jgi:hypothetical protein
VLNQGAHLLSENDFLRNVLSILPLLSAQVLEKAGICLMASRSGMLTLTCLKVSITSCIFSPCFPKWEGALRRSGNGALGSYGISKVGADGVDALMLTCLPSS